MDLSDVTDEDESSDEDYISEWTMNLTKFECTVSNDKKTPRDYKEFIKLQEALLERIKLQRTQRQITENEIMLLNKISEQIIETYKSALRNYPTDVTFHLLYFKFCKQENYANSALEAVTSMIRHLSGYPEVWQIAAKWYAYDQRDFRKALETLRTGLTAHKGSKLLYSELIEIKLFAIENKLPKPLDDFTLERLEDDIKESMENISDSTYYIDLLHMLESHKSTALIQTRIVEFLLQENNSDKTVLWDYLTQREYNDLQYKYNKLINSRPISNIIKNCSEKYVEFEKLPESTKKDFWVFYIDFLIEQQRKDFGLTDLINKILMTEFESCCDRDFLLEEHYIIWFEIEQDNAAETVSLEKGTNKYQYSVELWNLRLQDAITRDNIQTVDCVFRQAVETLKEKSLQIWNMALNYHLLTSKHSYTASLYEIAIKQPLEISEVLKPQYIEWLAFFRGIKAARKKYFALAVEKPYCKNLHFAMLKLEQCEVECNLTEWEEVHKIACAQFGSEDADVWLNYVYFYIYYKEVYNSKDRIKKICEKAKQFLPHLLYLDFCSRYEIMIKSAFKIRKFSKNEKVQCMSFITF